MGGDSGAAEGRAKKGTPPLSLFFAPSLSITNKSHVICSHVPDYIEEKGLPLGRSSDQLIENTHCQTNRIFNRSHYYVKDLNSPAHKKKLGQGINHFIVIMPENLLIELKNKKSYLNGPLI